MEMVLGGNPGEVVRCRSESLHVLPHLFGVEIHKRRPARFGLSLFVKIPGSGNGIERTLPIRDVHLLESNSKCISRHARADIIDREPEGGGSARACVFDTRNNHTTNPERNEDSLRPNGLLTSQ